MISRRAFLETVAAAAAFPPLTAQSGPASEWGSPVFDLHFHLRPQPANNLAHLDGAGIAKANLLTRGSVFGQVKAVQAAAAGRFTWFNSADVTRPDAEQALTQAVKDGAHPNLFGDLSANSGNNALSRDPGFTAGFLDRHQNKLLFGSDCSCADGHGAGVSQANNPAATRLAGKCVARETLTVLKTSATPAIFRRIVWDNAHALLKIPA